jgi:hypothetical protein
MRKAALHNLGCKVTDQKGGFAGRGLHFYPWDAR